MSYNQSEFDDLRQDQDLDEPLDGRDSQPAEGSSDAGQNLDSADPLHGVDQVLEANDEQSLVQEAEAEAQDQRPEPDEQ